MTAVVIGAIVDIFLNAFLMPVWGCTGAAVATLLAEMTQMSIQLYYAKAMIVKSINFKTIYKFILSALVACFIVIVVRKIIDINAFVNLAITFTIYFGVYVGIIALFNLQAKS